MIELPSELQDTVRLLYSTSLNQSVQWPDIDEDQIGVHSASWSDAAKTLTATVENPMKSPGTIWIPTTPWEVGSDRPLDAFVNFWMHYPYAHHKLAAKQAIAVAGALNSAAGIIKSYKMSYIKIVQAANSELTQTYHIFGASDTFLFFHSGREAVPSFAGSLDIGETLQQVAPGETADRIQQDQAAVNSCITQLVKLSNTVHQDLAVQGKVIDQATTAMTGMQLNAGQAVAVLPDQSYVNPTPYVPYGGPLWHGDVLPPSNDPP